MTAATQNANGSTPTHNASNNGTPNNNGTSGTYAPKLGFYHPTQSGGGAAMRLDLKLTRGSDSCFFLELAPQKTAATRDGGGRSPATFDWEKKLIVKLGFTDVCEFLTVLEGRADKVGGQRNGLFHDNGKASAVISLQRNTEKGGYSLGVSKKSKEGGDAVRQGILLNDSEAIGLRGILQASLFYLAFGGGLTPPRRDTGTCAS